MFLLIPSSQSGHCGFLLEEKRQMMKLSELGNNEYFSIWYVCACIRGHWYMYMQCHTSSYSFMMPSQHFCKDLRLTFPAFYTGCSLWSNFSLGKCVKYGPLPVFSFFYQLGIDAWSTLIGDATLKIQLAICANVRHSSLCTCCTHTRHLMNECKYELFSTLHWVNWKYYCTHEWEILELLCLPCFAQLGQMHVICMICPGACIRG